MDSSSSSPGQNSTELPPKYEGRVIYYQVTNDKEEVENDSMSSITFKGNDIKELNKRLKEETNTKDVSVCKRNPADGKLFPLHLNLPPNNEDMTVFLVPNSSFM